MRWISCDPGSEGTGLVFWDDKVWHETHTLSSREDDWLGRVRAISSKLSVMLGHYDPSLLVIEYPSYFSGGKGQVAAESGSLAKLVFICGVLTDCAWRAGCMVRIVNVQDWKGTMKKTVTMKRLKRVAPTFDGTASHQWDALGIGYFHLGVSILNLSSKGPDEHHSRMERASQDVELVPTMRTRQRVYKKSSRKGKAAR